MKHVIMLLGNISTVSASSEFPLYTVAAVAIVIMGVLGYFIKNKMK